MPADSVAFDDTPCIAQAANPLALAQPVWTLGALARALMMVGALESVLEQSVRYATRARAVRQADRQEPGDPAAARVDGRRRSGRAHGRARRRGRRPEHDRPDASAAAFSIAAAKVRAGEAATRAAGIAHQVHGAIGFTREHALHFATRRLWAWREQFGSDAWWAERLGRAAIAGGAAAFWPSLTRRRFERAFDAPASRP